MKIKIDSLEFDGDKFNGIIKVSGDLNHLSFERWDIQRAVERAVSTELSNRYILEKGPEILSAINNNQIINAIIMKASGIIGGDK